MPFSLPSVSPENPQSVSGSSFRDSYFFEWGRLSLRTDWVFVVAIAICLAVGIASGHPGAGLIAAGSATATGFGAKQNIDDSRLLPMIFVSLGIALSTFVGMVVGHVQLVLVLIVAVWGFGCGLLAGRPSGYAWVGQECVVFLLIATAFPARPGPAALRAGVTLAGGALQILCISVLLSLFRELRAGLLSLAQYIRAEELLMRAAFVQATRSLRKSGMQDPSLAYALRLSLILAVGTAIYVWLHFPSGYWIPMTSLLVFKPGLVDTASRAIARTVGTIGGAILASCFVAQVEPSLYILAVCALLFAWLTYATADVNYALFSLLLTTHIVFLLSLAGASSDLIAQRRAWCTAIGGALALGIRLCVIGLRHRSRARAAGVGPPLEGSIS